MAYTQKQSSKSPVERTGRGIAAALFPDLHTATDAVRELKAAGFRDHDIGLALRNPSEAEEPPVATTGTRAAEEAASGAVGGEPAGRSGGTARGSRGGCDSRPWSVTGRRSAGILIGGDRSISGGGGRSGSGSRRPCGGAGWSRYSGIGGAAF